VLFRSIIGIVVNYRLGIFGSMATTNVSGNFAIEDQRVALQWVNKNIAAFGGDPAKVTIMGSSSGCQSVFAHLSSPASDTLYHTAACTSAPMGLLYPTLEATLNNTAIVFKHAGCQMDDVECMRNLPYEKIVMAQAGVPKPFLSPFMPYVDPEGDLPIQPFIAVKNGSYPDIPLLISFDRDDSLELVEEEIKVVVTPLTYPNYVSSFVNMLLNVDNTSLVSSELETLYPYNADISDGRPLISEMATDGFVACPNLNMLEGAVAKGKPPIYVYMFAHVYSQNLKSPKLYMHNAVLHGSDYNCVFDNPSDKTHFDEEEDKFCLRLNSAFSNFMQTGNPNIGRPLYPSMEFPVLNTKGDILILDTASKVGTYPRYDICLDFWNGINPNIHADSA